MASNISRVVGGGLFALFCTLIIAALSFYGVIPETLGHVCVFFAWIVGGILISTEIIPGKPVRHKAWAIVGLAVVMLLADLGIMQLRKPPVSTTLTSAPSDISAINDSDFFAAVTGWGVEAPLGGPGGEGYEDINIIEKLLPFKDKYQLIVVARANNTLVDWSVDTAIQKSNPFSIGNIGTTFRITVPFSQQFLRYVQSLFGSSEAKFYFYLCLIPRSLGLGDITRLDDVRAKGGHVFQPARGGGATLGRNN